MDEPIFLPVAVFVAGIILGEHFSKLTKRWVPILAAPFLSYLRKSSLFALFLLLVVVYLRITGSISCFLEYGLFLSVGVLSGWIAFLGSWKEEGNGARKLYETLGPLARYLCSPLGVVPWVLGAFLWPWRPFRQSVLWSFFDLICAWHCLLIQARVWAEAARPSLTEDIAAWVIEHFDPWAAWRSLPSKECSRAGKIREELLWIQSLVIGLPLFAGRFPLRSLPHGGRILLLIPVGCLLAVLWKKGAQYLTEARRILQRSITDEPHSYSRKGCLWVPGMWRLAFGLSSLLLATDGADVGPLGLLTACLALPATWPVAHRCWEERALIQALWRGDLKEPSSAWVVWLQARLGKPLAVSQLLAGKFFKKRSG
jgi:hypothetical protein